MPILFSYLREINQRTYVQSTSHDIHHLKTMHNVTYESKINFDERVIYDPQEAIANFNKQYDDAEITDSNDTVINRAEKSSDSKDWLEKLKKKKADCMT